MSDTPNTEPVILSIMILTRNRKQQLLRALQSCVECSLPEKVEFVIVDNASEDGTREAVDHFFQMHAFEYRYFYLSQNIGAAAGRNEGFRRSRGRYIYFIDDDAYIDGPKRLFFGKMMTLLQKHSDVFCVTTSIYDIGLKRSRSVIASRQAHIGAHKKALFFHGGSFLVDKQRGPDSQGLFYPSQIGGMEELYTSLKSLFHDRCVLEMSDLNVIHDPGECSRYFTRQGIILHYAGAARAKLVFYPLVSYPLVCFVYCLRIMKHLGISALGEALGQLSRVTRGLKKETVPFRRLVQLIREFGVAAAL